MVGRSESGISSYIIVRWEARLPNTPVLNSRCDFQAKTRLPLSRSSSSARRVHCSLEPRTEPALGFFCALKNLLVKLVYSSVDLLASAVELPLGLDLGLLVLLPRLYTILVELLFGSLRLGLGLVCLLKSVKRTVNYGSGITYVLLSGGAYCLVALLAGLLKLLVLAREVALCAPCQVCSIICCSQNKPIS
jgi:hypothetical protein